VSFELGGTDNKVLIDFNSDALYVVYTQIFKVAQGRRYRGLKLPHFYIRGAKHPHISSRLDLAGWPELFQPYQLLAL